MHGYRFHSTLIRKNTTNRFATRQKPVNIDPAIPGNRSFRSKQTLVDTPAKKQNPNAGSTVIQVIVPALRIGARERRKNNVNIHKTTKYQPIKLVIGIP